VTVRELSEKLRQLNPESEATIFVRVCTHDRSVARVTPFDVDPIGIWIQLPENMHVVERNYRERDRVPA
jgi:hypothetical protein